MAVNLTKGQKIVLKKDSGAALSKVTIGLGWDVAESTGFFSMFSSQDIDCDASVFLLKGGKLVSDDDIVYFGNLEHKSGSVCHMGDNLTGEGEGDDEQVVVELARVPQAYDRLVFVVNIYKASSRDQQFGMVKNAFIRICDEKGHEFCRYDLSGKEYDGMTAMIFGEVYRHNGEWKFNAIGQGTKDDCIDDLAERYQ